MASVNDLRGYKRFATLEWMYKMPSELEKESLEVDTRRTPLDPRIGHGFSFFELVAFLEALDNVEHSFNSLPKYCVNSLPQRDDHDSSVRSSW
jgi:hypothetical protein